MDPSRLLEGYTKNFLVLEQDHFNALENMRTCRTIAHGGRILKCKDCGNQVVVYNPCNQRGCPVCSKKNQIQWAEKLKGKLLPTSHYHLTFSIPEELTEIWKLDKKMFIDSFFYSVQKAFKHIQKDINLTLGIVMVFQSHGTGLCFKPHMHCIVTDHGLDPDNKWVLAPTLSYTTLQDVVKKNLIAHLKKKMHPWLRNHLKDTFNASEAGKWSVYPAYHKFGGESIVNYLSKSVSGVVIDIENDLDYNHEEGIYTIRDRHMGKERSTTLEVNTFWFRYLSHIPPKGTVTIRNYGLYSNRYSDKLERIRINEYGMESSTDQKDHEQHCPDCHKSMVVTEEFTSIDLPLLIRLHMRRNNDPPEHGFSFKSA